MNTTCLGKNKKGEQCSRLPDRATGYCRMHTPKELTLEEKIAESVRIEKERRDEIADHIRSISDLESLKEAQKEVAIAIMDGVIDNKSAGAIVQLLRHQAELIKNTAPPPEVLTEAQGGTLLERSKNMTETECFELLQDWNTGLKKLIQAVQTVEKTPALLEAPAETVEAQQVTEVSDGFEQTANSDSEREGRIPEASEDSAEIF